VNVTTYIAEYDQCVTGDSWIEEKVCRQVKENSSSDNYIVQIGTCEANQPRKYETRKSKQSGYGYLKFNWYLLPSPEYKVEDKATNCN